jgi:hypothetical protein
LAGALDGAPLWMLMSDYGPSRAPVNAQDSAATVTNLGEQRRKIPSFVLGLISSTGHHWSPARLHDGGAVSCTTSFVLPPPWYVRPRKGNSMNDLVQIQAVTSAAISRVIGIQSNGAVWHGEVVSAGPGRFKIIWTRMEEDIK